MGHRHPRCGGRSRCRARFSARAGPLNRTLLLSTSGSYGPFQLRRVFSFRSARFPLFLTHAGDGSGRIFVLEKRGVIQVWYPEGQTVRHAAIFLAIHDRVVSDTIETDLFSLAFHPDYAQNGRLFVFYSGRDSAGRLVSRISEFTVSGDPDSAVNDNERIILELPKVNEIHFGGHLAFGPDGFLYAGIGDDDRSLEAQNLSSLYGSILRLDVDSRDLPYGIPPDNPFVDGDPGSRAEIWAYGLRNPWRFSFDEASGSLLAGDVGSSFWEEVNLIVKGQNYGWPTLEGDECHSPKTNCQDADSPFVAPLVAYDHGGAASVTGGYVYDHPRLPDLGGAFLYGDFVDGRIWGLRHQKGELISNELLAVSSVPISSFGIDESGELYIVGYDGSFYVLDRLDPNQPDDVVPETLRREDLFADALSQSPATGLIPYSVNSELWSDGAFKTRFIGLPGTETIGFSPGAPWEFPVGTVLVKNFSARLSTGDKRLLETRLLVKDSGGEGWSGFSYLWDEEGEQAALLDDARTVEYQIPDPNAENGVLRYTHYFPSRNDCRTLPHASCRIRSRRADRPTQSHTRIR